MGSINSGIFTEAPATATLQWTLGFLLVVTPLVVACAIAGWQWLRVSGWRGYGWYSLLTALLFSITALSFPGVLILFLDGISTSWVRERTGSSLNVAVIHVINDTVNLIIAYVLVAQHIAR